MTHTSQPLIVERRTSAYWRATIDNPPINLFDPEMTRAFADLIDRLEADDHVKVVVFDSANPEFFMAHIDIARIPEIDLTPGPTGMAPWPDAALRFERAPFITIASIRGRARGVGSELAQAMDIRFASRETAILEHPEVPMGFIPGGGGLERLWRLTGRARALEIIAGGQDFDADTAERYGWINRAIPDAELDAFVDHFATRIASFDKPALAATKEFLRQHAGVPTVAELESTEKRFFELQGRPESLARVAALMDGGLQTYGDIELNLGARVGPALEDDRAPEPDSTV